MKTTFEFLVPTPLFALGFSLLSCGGAQMSEEPRRDTVTSEEEAVEAEPDQGEGESVPNREASPVADEMALTLHRAA